MTYGSVSPPPPVAPPPIGKEVEEEEDSLVVGPLPATVEAVTIAGEEGLAEIGTNNPPFCKKKRRKHSLDRCTQ